MYESFVLFELSYGITDIQLGKWYRENDDKEKMVEIKKINHIWFFLLYMIVLFKLLELLEYLELLEFID